MVFGHQGLSFGHKGLPFGDQGLSFGHQGLPFGDQGQRLESSTGQYGVCWDDAGVTKAQLTSSAHPGAVQPVTAAVQYQPAPTIPPRSGCAPCAQPSAFKPTGAMQIFLATLLAVILLLSASFYHSLLCIHLLKMMVYILCTITLPNRNTTYHSHFCPLQYSPSSLTFSPPLNK